MTRPTRRSHLIHRPPVSRHQGEKPVQDYLRTLFSYHADGGAKKDAEGYLDFAEQLAHEVFQRHGVISPLQRQAEDTDRDHEIDFADDILARVRRLRSDINCGFKGCDPEYIAVNCFALWNAVSNLKIEFGLGPAYSAGAKTIAAGKIAAHETAQKRQQKIHANHQRWTEIDMGLSRALSASSRAGLIERQVKGTEHEGSARSIRQFLGKRVGKTPATLPTGE